MEEVHIVGFRRCSHCMNRYYLFVHYCKKQTNALNWFECNSKQEAVGLLEGLRERHPSLVCMNEYNHTAMQISHCTLPEYSPDREVLQRIQGCHEHQK